MRHRLLGFVVPICMCVFILSSMFQHRAVVPTMIFLAIICIIDGRFINPLRTNKLLLVLVVGVTLTAVWLAISLAWAPAPESNYKVVLKFLGNAFAGIVIIAAFTQLEPVEESRIFSGLLVGATIVFIYLVANVSTNGFLDQYLFERTYRPQYGYFWYKPLMALLSMLSLIFAFWFWTKGYRMLAFTIVTAIATLTSAVGFKAGIPAVIVGIVALVLVYFGRQRAVRFCLIVALVAMIFMPLPLQVINATEVTTEQQSQTTFFRSVTHRLLIWEFTSERIAEQPVYGWGLGASRSFGETHYLNDEKHRFFTEAIPLHPHNGALQVWLELGVIGILLFSALLALALRAAALSHPIPAAPAFSVGLIATSMFFWFINFGVWSSWWQTYIWFTAAVMVMSVHSAARKNMIYTDNIKRSDQDIDAY